MTNYMTNWSMNPGDTDLESDLSDQVPQPGCLKLFFVFVAIIVLAATIFSAIDYFK